MLKRKGAVLLVLLAALGVSALAAYRRATATERSIEAAYGRFNQALKRKDFPALAALLAPDYTEKRLLGPEEGRPKAEARYRRTMEEWVRFDKQIIEIDGLRVKGREAVVTVNKLTVGVLMDRNGVFGPKGRSHSMRADSLDVDTWVRTPGGWQLKRRQIALARLLVDGKPFGAPDHGKEGHTHPYPIGE